MPKITQLGAMTTPSGDDVLPIVDKLDGVTKKITRADLLKGSALPDDTVTTDAITDEAVTTNKIADEAVTAGKTAFGGDYSTTEVDTGFKWVDGKSIYKRTFTGEFSGNATTNLATITSLENVVELRGIWKSNVNNIFNFPHTTSITQVLSYIQFNGSENRIKLVSNDNYVNGAYYITIQYTKA